MPRWTPASVLPQEGCASVIALQGLPAQEYRWGGREGNATTHASMGQLVGLCVAVRG